MIFIPPKSALFERHHVFTSLQTSNIETPITKYVPNYQRSTPVKFENDTPSFDMPRHEFSLEIEQMDKPALVLK